MKDCGLGTPQEAHAQRRDWNCGHLDIHPSHWRSSSACPAVPMGAPPVWRPEYVAAPAEPHDAGCPGSWYRARFANRLLRYLRPMSADGVYSESIALTRCTDPLVLEAVRYCEHEMSLAFTRNSEVMRG